MGPESAASDYDFRRFHERKKYPVDVVFFHTNQLYAGSLINLRLGGAYIETYCVNQFSKKDIIYLSIPFSSGKNIVKRRGSIQWFNNAGFGVEFI